MKKALITGLVALLLASFNLNIQAQDKKEKNKTENLVYESWDGHTQKTPYMKYREEKERQELQKKNADLEKKSTRNIKENLTEEDTCYYIVKEGDKGYWNIADRVLGNEKRWKQIQNMNKGLKSEYLKPGQKILIPCK